MKTTMTLPAQAVVSIGDVAENFARMDSTEQAIMLEELFDALRFECGSTHNMNAQLIHVAMEIKRRGLTNLIEALGSLDEFLKDGDV